MIAVGVADEQNLRVLILKAKALDAFPDGRNVFWKIRVDQDVALRSLNQVDGQVRCADPIQVSRNPECRKFAVPVSLSEKRGGRVEIVRLDWEDEEGRIAFEPSDRLTPETLYDAQWALLLLRRATHQLEQEQVTAGKAESFRTLKCFLSEGGVRRAGLSYEQAARALNLGVPTIKTLVHRLRQRHTQLVRAEVERTVLDPAEVDAELRSLSEALLVAEGRVGS